MEVLHDQELRALIFCDRIDRDDVVVLKPGHGAGFPQEAFDEGGIPAQVGMDPLDRHDTIQGTVQSLIDNSHAAFGDFALDDIFAGKNLFGHPRPFLRVRLGSKRG